MNGGHPIMMEIKKEVKWIGWIFSLREFGYLAVALVVIYMLYLALPPLIAFLPVNDAQTYGYITWGFVSVLILLVALILAFVPAGIAGLPGPKYKSINKLTDPQMRLDQWLVILFSLNKKQKRFGKNGIPYRRKGVHND